MLVIIKQLVAKTQLLKRVQWMEVTTEAKVPTGQFAFSIFNHHY